MEKEHYFRLDKVFPSVPIQCAAVFGFLWLSFALVGVYELIPPDTSQFLVYVLFSVLFACIALAVIPGVHKDESIIYRSGFSWKGVVGYLTMSVGLTLISTLILKVPFYLWISYFLFFLIIPGLPVFLVLHYRRIYKEINASKEIVIDEGNKMFRLFSDGGKLVFEKEISELVYLEAKDNYVSFFYVSRLGELSKSMHRLSMKRAEEMLEEQRAHFMRVHKSYIVNPEYVIDISGKVQSYKLQLANVKTFIPVSRTFNVQQLRSLL